MTHVVPPPRKKYPITGEAARKARYRAKQASRERKHAGPTNPYVSRKGTYYDQRIQRCKCEERAWHGGEGRCARCGKAL